MADRMADWSDERLGAAVAAVAAVVAFPEPGDLAERVLESVAAERPSPGRVLGWPARWDPAGSRWARAAVALAAAAAVLAGVLVLSSGARRAVAGWLGIGGVRIHIVPTLPSAGPLVSELDLGRPVTLAQARTEAGFRIRVPSDPALGTPDAIALRTGFIQHQVWLVYRARPGIPPAVGTGVAVLVSEFRGSIDSSVVKKLLSAGTSLRAVTVNGQNGFWISGRPHDVAYLDDRGRPLSDLVRLAGNVLVWDEGGLTFRIEADLPLARVLEIAASTR